MIAAWTLRETVHLLGPADPPLALLRGKHRVRLIVKAERQAPLQGLLRAMVEKAGPPRGGARLDIDIDPVNFF